MASRDKKRALSLAGRVDYPEFDFSYERAHRVQPAAWTMVVTQVALELTASRLAIIAKSRLFLLRVDAMK